MTENEKKSPRRDTRLRFEQWARNPACEANVISAVHGVPMALVAKAEGIEPTFGQSPFAIARGVTFERSLFRSEATTLRQALSEAGLLPATTSRFVDFRIRANGGLLSDLDAALEATQEFFRELADSAAHGTGTSDCYVLAGPVVRVPGSLMLPEAILVVDVMVVRAGELRPECVVGEIKTYPDRGGYTDTAELATARAQAGIYVQGLRLVLGELGLAEAVDISSFGFLVLTRPGSNRPSIRAEESLEYQAKRAARGFDKLRMVADAMPRGTSVEDMVPIIRAAPTNYCEACLAFCDLSQLCHAKAIESGHGVIIGDAGAQFLGQVSVPRAAELLKGNEPANEAEADLLRRMREARGDR